MRRFVVAAGLAIAVMALGSTEALARGRGHCGGGMGPGMMAALQLTPDQQQAIDALKAETEAKVADTRARLDAKRAELQALWAAESPDEEAILAKHAEMDPLRRELRQARVRLHIEMLEVLTPEQRATLRNSPRWGKGHGRCPHGCGPGGPGGFGPGGGMGL